MLEDISACKLIECWICCAEWDVVYRHISTYHILSCRVPNTLEREEAFNPHHDLSVTGRVPAVTNEARGLLERPLSIRGSQYCDLPIVRAGKPVVRSSFRQVLEGGFDRDILDVRA